MALAVPPTDSEHRGYYEAARRHQLVVQECSACQRLRTGFGAACPFCTNLTWSWHEVSGGGTIFSYEIVVRAVNPAFSDWAPYPIVLVELDEQRHVPWAGGFNDETVSLRMVTNLVRRDDLHLPESEELVAIGRRVEVCFIDLEEQFSLPQFRLSEEAPTIEPWRATF